MTEKQLERIVNVWQERLGLERWKIKVDFVKPCDPENTAEVVRSEFYDTGTIRLDPGWKKWSDEEAETTLLHELLHLLHRDVDEAFNDVEGQLHRDAWTMAERRYRHAMEGFVDRLSSRLAELT